ncbi:hypothetical protein IMCC26207_110166 [Actinobacteria bacterium IMCC26207]|nr:hypothetical protein IMCC26207_110166 [Actinobacteria bacterium IMCC26207]
MATKFLYPYKVVPEAITVQVLSTSLEDELLGPQFDLRELTESAGATFQIAVRCSIAPETVKELLPAGSDPFTSVSLGIREFSIKNRRRRIHAAPDGVLDHTFDLVFEVDDNWGKLELKPVLLLRSDLAAEPGLAKSAGSVLTWGSPLALLFDTPESFSGGSMLEVEWRNFEEDAGLPNDALHALEIDARPKLLLNSSSAAAYDILRSEATRGKKARLRDVAFASIATAVWTTLISVSFAALRAEAVLDPSLEADELLNEMAAWQRAVLEAWAPRLAGEADPVTAMSELAAAAKTNEVDILGRLDRLISEELNQRRRFELLAQDALGD